MKPRHKSLAWAFNQFVNRSLQDWSYKKDRGFSKPTRIIFCVTLRCNIRCEQCAIWRMPKAEELKTEEWKRVLSELREWIGPYRVQLAGGETFMRKDILELVHHASENDVLTGIVSNGTLIDQKTAREVVDSGLGYIHISVDGMQPATHDEVRGLPGIFSKTMQGIDHLIDASKGSGLAISIATVISKKNVNELLDLVKFTEEKGLNGIVFNPIGPTTDSDVDWYKKSDLWFNDFSEVDRVLDQLIQLKKEGAKILNPVEHFMDMKKYFRKPYLDSNRNCMVGVTNLSITCDGNVHTCYKMPPLGNVRDGSIREMWDSTHAKEVRQQIKACDIHCSPGNFVYRRSLTSEIRRFLRFG